MRRLFQVVSLALLVLAAAGPGRALAADPAVTTVQDFYEALTASMKANSSAQGQYDRLKPAVARAFDIHAMTALSVGPRWASMTAAEQNALTAAFERMTIANYVSNFHTYHGEVFTVDPAVIRRGNDKFVKSVLKPGSGNSIAFNYRLHETGGQWKIVDVYLAGNISQLAQKRSDFSATLATEGAQGLAKKINALADKELAS